MYKGAEISVRVADVDMMNKEQEGLVESGNAEREMSMKLKIRSRKKEAVEEIGFRGFLNLQADMTLGKLAVWLVRNFDTCPCSLPLTHGRIWVTEDDVQMTKDLCYVDGVVFMVRLVLHLFPMLRAWTNDEIKSRWDKNLKSYLDTLDNTTTTDEEEEVNKEERCNKSVEVKAKVKDQMGDSKVKALFWDDKVATDLIINNSRLLAEVMAKLAELLPGTCAPLKRVRKIAAKSRNDALIRHMLKKSKSRTW
ncbi:hypothetical protein Cgig2_022999 [Carnegiea gigantea]|uniref:Uncharacterized protein n=1 Tax=Carnegiea gigantea TaxID=171969 RepID=A0A9Q1KAT5_9CARY|nr:hypothetical protein Cgig2_022999 [Carnegiea gigantea]